MTEAERAHYLTTIDSVVKLTQRFLAEETTPGDLMDCCLVMAEMVQGTAEEDRDIKLKAMMYGFSLFLLQQYEWDDELEIPAKRGSV